MQFRGMGLPEHEIVVKSTVKEGRDGLTVTEIVAGQNGDAIIRDAEAEIAAG